MSHIFLQTEHSSQRPDWLAGVGGLELPYSETLGRGEPSFNPGNAVPIGADIPCRNEWTSIATGASVSSVDVALFASSQFPPRWRYRHCGASVVTARVPSQT